MKIIKVKKMIPEIREIFLGFKSAEKILTDDFLNTLDGASTTDVVSITETAKMTAEMKKIIGNKADAHRWKDETVLIENTNTKPFYELLGKKAVHKSSISKLIKELLDPLPPPSSASQSQVKASPDPSTPPKPSDLYNELWRFMDYEQGSIGVLRTVFEADKFTPEDKAVLAPLVGVGGAIDTRRKDLTWKGAQSKGAQSNILFDELFMTILSQCYKYEKKVGAKNPKRTGTGENSTFLTEKTASKGNQKYRFMLNWVILIAFHLYHTDSDKTLRVSYKDTTRSSLDGADKKQQILIDCRELLEHLHYMFVGWMRRMDSRSLLGIFTKGATTYKSTVNDKINAGIKRDPSLQPLLFGIQDFLCNVDPQKPTNVDSWKPLDLPPLTPSEVVRYRRPVVNRTAAAAALTSEDVQAEYDKLLLNKDHSKAAEAGSMPLSSLLPLQDSPASSAVSSPRDNIRMSMGSARDNPDQDTEKIDPNLRPELVKHLHQTGQMSQGDPRGFGPLPTAEDEEKEEEKYERQDATRKHLGKLKEETRRKEENKLRIEHGLPPLPAGKPSFARKTNPTSSQQTQQNQSQSFIDNTSRTQLKTPQTPRPPLGNPLVPRTSKRKGGGNKHRTRKRPRIVRSHHNTKRKISNRSKPRENHKYTRKARPAGV